MSVEPIAPCPGCGADVAAEEKVCSACGMPLRDSDPDETLVSAGDAEQTLAERRVRRHRELLFGRFEVHKELGRGGMGRVLRVLDTQINEVVALKLIKPEYASRQAALERFRAELRLARRVAHPNVCRMYEFQEAGDTAYITMEYVAGRDLRTLLRHQRGELLPVERVLEIGLGVCAGLEEAHRMGVIHRDLKPQNIMIDEAGRPRIMDFGLAHAADDPTQARPGSLVGTAYYMSPEQAAGEPLDHRSDIYSLGTVLFEMITGEPPYGGTSAVGVAMKHRTEPVPDPVARNPKIPPVLGAAVRRCLEKKPDRRFQDVAELRAALLAVGSDPLTGTAEITVDLPAFLLDRPSEESAPIFAAREEELAKLGEWLESVLDGQGRVGFITGGAGSGKTSLALEFARRMLAEHPQLIVVGGRCVAHTGVGNPYLPFREALDLLTGNIEASWVVGGMTRGQAERLWALLPISATALAEYGPGLLETFVSTDGLLRRASAAASGGAPWLSRMQELVEKRTAAAAPDPQAPQLLDQYVQVLRRVSEHRAMIVLLDDLHWVDAGSVDLLFQLSRQIGDRRILVLGTHRQEEVLLEADGRRHRLARVVNELARDFGDVEIDLDRTEGRHFLDAYLDSQPNRFTAAFRDALFQHTAGHALFTVELMRAIEDRGVIERETDGFWVSRGTLDWGALPSRIDGTLSERLDRLGQEQRQLLAIAAVEGEEFTAEVVARVAGIADRDAVRLLSGELNKKHRLVAPLGLRRVGRQRLSRYGFRHMLFQVHLYDRLDDAERSYQHEAVAETLEELYGEQKVEIAVDLARHFEIAKVPERAFLYQQIAGARALGLSAYDEATLHLRSGLALLDSLPESPERRQQELETVLGLSVALAATEGYSANEVAELGVRARRVCERGEIPHGVPLLFQLWGLQLVRAGLDVGEIADQLDQLADRSGDPLKRAYGAFARGVTAFYRGDQKGAAPLLDRAVAAFDGNRRDTVAYGAGDPLLTARLYRTWNLLVSGEPAAAWALQQQALHEAEKLETPFELATALNFAAAVGHDLGLEASEIHDFAARALAVSSEAGFPFWMAVSTIWVGWAQAVGGDRAGIELLGRGIEGLRAMRAGNPLPMSHVALAEACRRFDLAREGLQAIDDCLALSGERENRFYDAEAHRIRGQLLLLGSDPEAAETAYRRALAVADEQGARLYALRAATDLARMLRELGRRDEGRRELEARAGGFTDGLETPPLRAAALLLADLA